YVAQTRARTRQHPARIGRGVRPRPACTRPLVLGPPAVGGFSFDPPFSPSSTRFFALSKSSTRTGGPQMKMVALALATLLTGFAITANASVAARGVQQKVVRYADLNMESDVDAAILFTRIRGAARTVCGLRTSIPQPLEILERLAACANDATARAVAEV